MEEERLHRLEERIEALAGAVEDLGRRLSALEGRAAAAPPAGEARAGASALAEALAEEDSRFANALRSLPALVGRTFLVLAGAYLLRALTESGVLGPEAGVGAGLAYAAFWTWMADRAARAGWTMSATFHGAATALVAFPLVWEASTRFRVLGPALGAALLAAFSLGALAVAWRRGLRALATLVALAALFTATGLLFAVPAPVAFATLLLGTAAGALLVSYERGWLELRVLPAIALDLVVLFEGIAFGTPRFRWLPGGAVVATGIALMALYLGGGMVRTLALGRPADLFDAGQCLVALAVGFGGALHVVAAGGGDVAPLGAAALALAVLFSAVTFLHLERRQGAGANCACYATLAMVLALAGFGILLPAPASAAAFALMALGAAALGTAAPRGALRVHAAILLAAAAGGSGLIQVTARAFAGRAALGFPPPAAILVLALSLVSYGVLRLRAGEERASWTFTVPGFLLALLAALGVGGALVAALAPLAAGPPGALDAGALAALRTGVLAALAVGAAALGRSRRRPEFAWLAYLALGLAAAKVLVEDIPAGRPATLFLTLALFGGALVAASAVLRRTATSAGPR